VRASSSKHVGSFTGGRRWGATAGVLGVAGLAVGQLAAAAQAASPGGTGSLAPYTATRLSSLAVNGDTNPYSIAVVPISAGKLVAGNVLAVDFNHAGTAGAGKSIVQVNPSTGATSAFASGLPISGPVGIAINPVNDGVWIGGFGSVDGSNSNDLLILPDGTVKANYNATSVHAKPGYAGVKPTFDGVWGEGVSKHAGQVSFYYGTTGSGATGGGGGQLWRIDPHPTGVPNGQPVNSTYAQIATGLAGNATAKALPVAAANAAGPQGFAYDNASGILYVANDANNTITAVPGAAGATGPVVTRNLPVAARILNVPENIALDPTNGDLLAVNAGTNTLVELNPSTGAVVGSRLLDTGAKGALFGLAVTTDAQGKLVIFYGNDNDNTLNVLRASASTPAAGTPGASTAPSAGQPTGSVPTSVQAGSGGQAAAEGFPVTLVTLLGTGGLLATLVGVRRFARR